MNQPYSGPRKSRSPSPHSSRRDEVRTRNQPYSGPRRSHTPSPHSSRRHEARTPKQPHSRPRRSRAPSATNILGAYSTASKERLLYKGSNTSQSTLELLTSEAADRDIGMWSGLSPPSYLAKELDEDRIFCWQLAHFVGGLHMREGEISATESAIQSIACVSVHNDTADELRSI